MSIKKAATVTPHQKLTKVFDAMAGHELSVTDNGNGQYNIARDPHLTELAVAARGAGCEIHFNFPDAEKRHEPRLGEIVVHGAVAQRDGSNMTWRVSHLHVA